MRVSLAILLILLAALSYEREFGRGGRRDVAALQARLTTQQARLDRLRARNDSLTAQVADLKAGRDAIEEIARTELGMVRRGETFVQVFGGPDGTGPGSETDEGPGLNSRP